MVSFACSMFVCVASITHLPIRCLRFSTSSAEQLDGAFFSAHSTMRTTTSGNKTRAMGEQRMVHAETSPPHFVCTAQTRAQIALESSATDGVLVVDAIVLVAVGTVVGPGPVLPPLHATMAAIAGTTMVTPPTPRTRIARTLARTRSPDNIGARPSTWHESAMAKVNELPPAPENPLLPPEISLPGEEPLVCVADDGTKIDARVVVPVGARRIVVLSHPHPLYGGTMNNAVVVALSKVLFERGAAVVRFDFRGVGKSEGVYGGGEAEIADVLGVVRSARDVLPGAPIATVGYSFGAWVSLRATMRSPIEIERTTVISPAARIFDFLQLAVRRADGTKRDEPPFAGPKAIVVGDRDEFCDVDEAKRIAEHLHASLTVVRGADHFFLTGRRRLAEVVAPFALGESDTLPSEVEARSP